MTMPCSDSLTESKRNPTRKPFNCYVAPHLRNTGGGSYGYGYVPPIESTQYGFRQSYTGRPGKQADRNGRGRGGGGRGGGHFWAQPPPNPFDNVSEKFDQLKVTEEESGGNGGINSEAYEDIPVEASGEDIPPPVDTATLFR
ncbi:DEAD-box ATP-dependent RNA helicase 52C-like [Pyrus communis]|uniref:DEAD-box ATP-dependent RNA helicase 52C-like n=1 Tax=Pyrus communis TaxID=23211 RepID=UPI0035C20156